MTYNEFQQALADRYALAAPACDMILGYHALTDWPNNVIPAQPEKQRFRARAFFSASVEKQATLAPAGSRRFEVSGLFYFQLYGPANLNTTNALLGTLAEAVAAVFRGVSEPNGVWYRDVTIQGQPPSSEWHSVRVGGKYLYTRFG